MQVVFKHSYYNSSRNNCPDFTVYPTPSTLELMRSLGLIFKDDGIGFSILYNQQVEPELISYLKRQANCGQSQIRSDHGAVQNPVSMRLLSFALVSTNPNFVTITEIPISMNPLKRNFYFCNQWSHGTNTLAILNQGPYVAPVRKPPGALRNNYLRVISSQYAVRDLDKSQPDEVSVSDISGDVVECKPRCIPKALAREVNPSTVTCEDVKLYLKSLPGELKGCDHWKQCRDAELSEPCCYCRDEVLLNFGGLPLGRYRIEEVYTDDGGDGKYPKNVLYTQSSPTPLCFIDLLFSELESDQSTADDETGVYPIRNLCGPDTPLKIDPVYYELRFENRSTFWRYFIVPQPQAETFSDLRIESTDGPPVQFSWPAVPIRLPNGQKAYRIESIETIPLQEKSTTHLRLIGRQGHASRDRVIVQHLPVAPVDQVHFADLNSSESPLYSEIYVYV